MSPTPPDLVSWKEIAAYFKVSVRTAQIWERERGLPVQRVPGARSQVRASVAALDAWKSSNKGEPAPPEIPPQRKHLQFVAIALLPFAGLILWMLLRPRHGEPATSRVAGHTLIVSDSNNAEVWRITRPEIEEGRDPLHDSVTFFDLDGSGHLSTLFLEHGLEGGTDSLLVLDYKGEVKWSFTPHDSASLEGKPLPHTYYMPRFLVARLGRDRKLRVAVAATHRTTSASQITLLDTEGKELRNYWHNGHLNFLVPADVAGEGWNALVVAGVTNPRRSATIIALDPDKFGGFATEENKADQFDNGSPPVEMIRAVFPRSDVSGGEVFLDTTKMWLEDGGAIGMIVQHRLYQEGATLFYHLNPNLTVRSLDPGSGFRQTHAALPRGEQHGDLTQAELDDLQHLTYIKR